MIALLEALREKDPATWGKWQEGLLDSNRIAITMYGSPLSGAWLQAVLQEACRERGWGLHQMIFNASRQRPYAMISDGKRAPIYAEGDSPAEALLSCYLEAIG